MDACACTIASNTSSAESRSTAKHSRCIATVTTVTAQFPPPTMATSSCRDAFERSLTCASDAAPRCLYADWLSRQGDAADRERAKSLYSEIVHDARHWPRHAREHNREWLQRAQVALGQ